MRPGDQEDQPDDAHSVKTILYNERIIADSGAWSVGKVVFLYLYFFIQEGPL